MDPLFSVVSEKLSSPWLWGIFFLLWAGDKSGVIKWVFGRSGLRQQQFLDDVMTESERQRKARWDDGTNFEARILALETRLRQKDELLATEIRGSARLRHALNTLMQYVYGLRYMMQRAGLPVLPFDKWDEFMALDAEAAQKLRDLLADTEAGSAAQAKLPDPSD